jgi:ubiquitin-conjugating enzyme E2 I
MHESMADSMVHFDAAVADVPEEKEDGIAVERLRAGLKDWHKDPLVEFFVTPQTDWKIWKVGIPGKNGTPWEGGLYKATITFTADFPFKPPSLKFTPVIFHPNVYQSGRCYVHSMLR